LGLHLLVAALASQRCQARTGWPGAGGSTTSGCPYSSAHSRIKVAADQPSNTK
jgi:hypothetical protein